MPALEIAILILLFISSWVLVRANFNASLTVLILLSVLLHKEFFSIFRWDLLPVRVFMLAFVLENARQFIFWFRKNRDWKRVRKFLSQPLLLTLTSVWVVSGISIIFTLNLRESILLYGFLTTMVALGFILYHHLEDQPDKILGLVKIYIYVMFGLCLFGFVQLFVYQKTGFIFGALWNVPGRIARIGATFWDVNHFGAVLAALLPVLGVFVLVEKSIKKRLAYALMMVPMVGMLLLTNSRSAWILAFVAFLSFLLIQLVKKWGMKGIFTLLLVLGIMTTVGLIEYSDRQSPFRAYIKDSFHYRIDSFNSHLFLLQGAFQVLEKYPYFGGGYGSFFEQFSQTEIAPNYFGRDPISLTSGLRAPGHSIWGETAAETGWAGLYVLAAFAGVVVLTMIYSALTVKDKAQSLIASAMGSSMIGWFAAGTFYSYKAEFFWIILFLYFLYCLSVLSRSVTFEQILGRFAGTRYTPRILILVIGAVLIFWGLGSNHLIPWDEAIYAEIAKNMADTGDWLSMRWQLSTVWYEKPPLYIWLAGGAMKLFGFTEFAARLPSALFGVLGALVTYTFGRRLFGKTAGFVSALALLTTTFYIYYSRTAMLDVTVAFFTTSSLYFYWRANEDREKLKFWLLTGVFVGLGVLVKNVVGLLPFVIIGIYELYLLVTKQAKFELAKYLIMFSVSMVVFLPWHIVMYLKYGQNFLDNYFFYHILKRGTAAIEDKGNNPIWWYVVVMKVGMRIWFVALLAALPHAVFKAFRRKDNRYVFLLVSFLVIFAFFTAGVSKLVWYIMPIYPIACIVVGAFVQGAINLDKKRVVKALAIYTLTAFSLFYLFLVRDLVYTDDLTGAEAQLLQLKEQTFGTEHVLYVDKVAPPVALFYLDGPFREVEYSEIEGKLRTAKYNEPVVYLTKSSRQERIVGLFPRAISIGAVKDHVLGFLDSEYSVDQMELARLQTLYEAAPTLELALQIEVLEQRIEANLQN